MNDTILLLSSLLEPHNDRQWHYNWVLIIFFLESHDIVHTGELYTSLEYLMQH